MIHRLIVDAATEFAPLKKEFRRALMTGGAVVRLAEGLGPAELEALTRRFKGEASSNNLAALVLEEISSAPACSPELRSEITALDLENVTAAHKRMQT